MSMGIELKEGLTLNEITTIAKVGLYLGGMVEVMGKKSTSFGANRAANAYMKENPLTVSDKKMALKTIDGLTADYEKRAEAGKPKLGKEAKKALALGAAAVVAGVMASSGIEPALASVSLTLAAGAMFTGAHAVTNKEKPAVSKEEYANIKHTLVALNKMRNALDPKPSYRDEVRALYASGLGNPGGMITALKLKREGR